jgi:hypothetical protein
MCLSRFRTHLVALALFVAFSSAHADWEASFNAQSSKGSFSAATGKFYSRTDRVRVDTNVPIEVSFYLKAGNDHVDAAIHSFHMHLTTKLGKISTQFPACIAKSFDDCVKKYALKKIREESCSDGGVARTCEVYSADTTSINGVKKIELSHWKGESEPILVSTVVTKKDGDIITVHFTKITKKTRDASFYSVPANYVNAGSLDRFLGDFKGKSE